LNAFCFYFDACDTKRVHSDARIDRTLFAEAASFCAVMGSAQTLQADWAVEREVQLPLVESFAGDLWFTDVFEPLELSQSGEVGRSVMLEASDPVTARTLPKPGSKRLVSNRKAQQRFRQRLKVKKAADTSELQHLKQRVKELEEQISKQPMSSNSTGLFRYQ
jgi:hypothetical protein